LNGYIQGSKILNSRINPQKSCIQKTNSQSPRFIPVAFRPTAEQERIQIATDRNLIIEANAGAAKTTTLALRVGEALARGVEPEAILCLTFTNEAKDVLRKRIEKVGVSSKLANLIRIETFENFSKTILRNFEGSETRELAEKHLLAVHAIRAIEQVGEKSGSHHDYLEIATHSLAVSQFIDAQLSIKTRMAIHQGLDYSTLEELAEAIGVTLTHLLTFYEYERYRLGLFDEARFRGAFDATYDLARFLESRPEILEVLPNFRTIACDELHDMNEAAFRILVAVLDKGRSFFVGAGDRDQVIHATLGADSRFLRERFEMSLTAVKRMPLTASYRYGPNLALAIGKFKEKRSDSALTLETSILQSTYPDGDWEVCADLVVKAVRDWEKETGSTKDCAILIRDIHQSAVIENALVNSGIGYRCCGMKGYLQRTEILFLRGILAIALGNLNNVQSKSVRKEIVESLVLFGRLDLGNCVNDNGEEISHYVALQQAKNLIADDPEILKSFFSGLVVEGTSIMRERIIDTVEFVSSVAAKSSADFVLKEVWSRMALESTIKRLYIYPHEAEVVIRSADSFVKLAAKAKLGLADFTEMIGRIETRASVRKQNESITLERAETSKGQEFGHVILPLLEEGEFPSSSASYSEEENLFYVAATRAKSRLTLISPATRSRQSRFVIRMGLGSSLSGKAKVLIETNKALDTSVSRIDLDVPYAAKDKAKELGAKWDPVRKKWFVKAGQDLDSFRCWLPEQ
jgi:DNA helicase-2/ATP-dependent DNA helicase PcrA